ncbi:MAG: hypothetical protein LBG52_03265 [Candidatus Peribacteria bacterium]|nr:hypothetical protein [Candidatus Peribacteria bacterium]
MFIIKFFNKCCNFFFILLFPCLLQNETLTVETMACLILTAKPLKMGKNSKYLDTRDIFSIKNKKSDRNQTFHYFSPIRIRKRI